MVGYIAVRMASFLDVFGAATCIDRYVGESSDPNQINVELGDCIRGRWAGWLTGITITQSAAIGGLGLLTHGVTYRRNLKLYRYMSGVSLKPLLMPTYAGLALGGRF